MSAGNFSKEIFISRAGADSALAIVIARMLADAGYKPFLQDNDFGQTSFMARMREGFDKVDSGARMVALLSRAYLASDYCMAEADVALTGDPSNKQQRLVVLRVEDCAPTGFLKAIPWAYDLTPVLHDATALARAAAGAIDPAAPEADFAAALKYATTQILHPEIRPVPGFTGREDLLEEIDEALSERGGAAALTNDARSAAVKGLGGVGKSVLAREYAWRARGTYHGVWWVRAETEQTLIDDLIDLGSRLIPGLKEVQERDRALHLALDAIAGAGGAKRWLIVYDNVEKPGTIRKLKPREHTHILITSRWPDWQDEAQELPVDVFAPELAMGYLLAKRPHETREAADRLADALGYLPLALSHARAYCAETNLSFDDYARRLIELIQEAPEDAEYPASVFATFSLAIAKAAEACPEAEELMAIAAFLAPERIPLDIITEEVMSPKQREKAVAALLRVSLVQHDRFDDGSPAINIHRLIQAAVRTGLGARCTGSLSSAIKLAERAAAEEFERGKNLNVRSLPMPRSAHMLAAWSHHNAIFGDDAGLFASNLRLEGRRLQNEGKFSEAEDCYRFAIEFGEQDRGPDHHSIATHLQGLTECLAAKGHYEEAKKAISRAVSILEKSLGLSHPKTVVCRTAYSRLKRLHATPDNDAL